MHHVTARSIAEEHIFRDAGDYATGIRILAELVAEGGVICHMFCFMPTHYHLLGTFEDIPRAIHKLNRRYATRFNRRYGRRGHVFDSPYARVEISDEEHLQTIVRYIALNPANPETWPFCSYPALIGLREPFAFVDADVLWDTFRTPEVLRAFVLEGLALKT